MTMNIFEAQLNSIRQILNCEGLNPTDGSAADALLWKVLIMDKQTQSTLATLMKVGGLRQHGVTLNLLITEDRGPVNSVPALYLIEPTRENIDLIMNDLKARLYHRSFINFTTPIDSSLLDYFAQQSAHHMCADQVQCVIDRYIRFISLSPNEFSVNLPNVFHLFHANGITDSLINQTVEHIVNSLISVIVTLGGVVPIIRCPDQSTSPAHMIGFTLHNRLKKLLSDRTTMRLFQSGPLVERPCLILVDREIDLFVMASHTWSYQTLVHDLFQLRLNRVTLPPSPEDNQSTPQPKTYDFDATDQLWTELSSKAFPDAAVSISNAFNEYNSKTKELNETDHQHNPDQIQSGFKSTIASLTAVPELVMRKRYLDTHTNVAHRLVTEITTRTIDQFYEFENTLDKYSVTSGMTQLIKLLSKDHQGSAMDKERAAFCFYLSKNNQLTPTHLSTIRQHLEDVGGSFEPIEFARQRGSLKALNVAQTSLNQASSGYVAQSGSAVSSSSSVLSRFTPSQATSLWGENLIDRTRDLLQVMLSERTCRYAKQSMN